jgi:hypothetical protein
MHIKSFIGECGEDAIDICLAQGETLLFEYNFTLDGVAYDITGYTFKMTFNFPTPVLLTNGSGITITDAVNGKISIELPSTATLDTIHNFKVDAGQYAVDFWIIASDGSTIRAFEGYINIDDALTRVS